MIFKDGSFELSVECFPGNVVVSVGFEGSEQYKVYGQGQLLPGSGGFDPFYETVSNRAIFIWGRDVEDENNNFPEGGAIHIEDVASGKEWYFGVDGSSFIGKVSENGSITTCDYSGVINIGTN